LVCPSFSVLAGWPPWPFFSGELPHNLESYHTR
jgi:hypothetical protein